MLYSQDLPKTPRTLKPEDQGSDGVSERGFEEIKEITAMRKEYQPMEQILQDMLQKYKIEHHDLIEKKSSLQTQIKEKQVLDYMSSKMNI